MKKAGLILAASMLALAGCKGDAKKDAGAGKAQGEVLPGSASDAMLPLDTVKSQAPLAPKSEGGEGGDKDPKAKLGAKASDAGEDAATEDKAAATPNASASSAED